MNQIIQKLLDLRGHAKPFCTAVIIPMFLAGNIGVAETQQNVNQQLAQALQNSGSSESTDGTENAAFNDASQFTPPPVTPPQDNGRKKGQDMAAAMAAVGAGIAGAMCAMLMREAMQHPPGSQERTQLMQQAAQQCSQAAQSAGNAAKNDDGAKKLTSKPTQQTPKLTSAKKKETKKAALPNFANNTTETEESESFPEITPPDVSDYNFDVPSGDGFDGSGEFEIAGAPDSQSLPDSLPHSKITFEGSDPPKKDSAQQGSASLISSNLSGTDFASLNNQKVAEALAAIDQSVGAVHKAGKKKGTKTKLGSIGSSGSGGFGDLMGSFFGGAADAASAGGGGSGQVINLGGASATKKTNQVKVNIFEYAAYRFKKLAHKQGKVRTQLRANARGLASN